MEAARQGDRAAFTALIDRHRPLLIALCRRALREHVLVEDAMQEAIQQALLNLNRLRDPARFGPRLAGIGLNVCRRMIHQRTSDWTWKAMSGGYRASLLVSDEPDPVAIVMANEEAARVRPAVVTLPPGQRQAVTLVYLAGLTGAEAAVALGINVGAARLDCTKRGNRCEARNLAILDGVPIQVARQLFNNAMTREPWDSQVSSVPGGEGASELAAQFMAAW